MDWIELKGTRYLKQNNEKISGVLHQNTAQQDYDLRRYYPEGEVANLVEQYWFVSWSLKDGQNHIQQNLPDPNCHLVFENGVAKLIGPVSKVYSYKMAKAGKILGVKFKAGALTKLLNGSMTLFIDEELPAYVCFNSSVDKLADELNDDLDDKHIVQKLQTFLSAFVPSVDQPLLMVNKQLDLIKNNAEIATVQQLSVLTNTSVRTLQRNFSKYLGLSPKWLIRKYRLHQALSALENQSTSISDIVSWLGYTDQSHLIRDFKDILGITPQHYLTGPN